MLFIIITMIMISMVTPVLASDKDIIENETLSKNAPVATIILQEGSTSNDLQSAIDSAVSGDTIIISSDVIFSSIVTIPSGKIITIQSTSENNWTLLQSNNSIRHFIVNGTLNLTNITLDGNNTGGGIRVNNGGTLKMYSNTSIQNSYNTNDGGGIIVYGIYNMYDGLIIGNLATKYGGVFINPDGTFEMHNDTINTNSSPYGSGVYCYGKFEMKDGDINNNTASTSR